MSDAYSGYLRRRAELIEALTQPDPNPLHDIGGQVITPGCKIEDANGRVWHLDGYYNDVIGDYRFADGKSLDRWELDGAPPSSLLYLFDEGAPCQRTGYANPSYVVVKHD